MGRSCRRSRSCWWYRKTLKEDEDKWEEIEEEIKVEVEDEEELVLEIETDPRRPGRGNKIKDS